MTTDLAVAYAVQPSRLLVLRDMWARYAGTLGAQTLTAGLGVITGVLAPRLLGPRGSGELAAVTLWPITLAFLGSFGMERATVFFAAKHRDNVSSVASSCLAWVTAQSFAVMLVGCLVVPLALRGHGPSLVRLGLVFLLCVPLTQAANLNAALFLGHLRTGWYNLSRSIAPACYALGVTSLFLLKLPSVSGVLHAQLAGYAVAAFVATRIVLAKLRPSWSWSPGTARGMLSYGLKTHAGQITSFLNQKLAQLLISLLLPASDLGIYLRAVAFADGLLIIPRTIGWVTLASASSSEGLEARRWTRRSLLLTAGWLVPAAVALWFLSPIAVPALFGSAFTPSILPLRILILGSCAMGLSTVLYEAARSANRPEIPWYAELVGFGVTVLLLALLLKPYGIIGAAMASTVAYTATLIFMLWNPHS